MISIKLQSTEISVGFFDQHKRERNQQKMEKLLLDWNLKAVGIFLVFVRIVQKTQKNPDKPRQSATDILVPCVKAFSPVFCGLKDFSVAGSFPCFNSGTFPRISTLVRRLQEWGHPKGLQKDGLKEQKFRTRVAAHKIKAIHQRP